MEITEIDVHDVPEQPQPALILTPEAQYYLKETAKWANFFGILGFVMCVLVLIISLGITAVFSLLSSISPMYSQMPADLGVILSIVFILCDLLYFFFALYLYQFAGGIKKGLALMDSVQITRALGKLKSFFKLCGIVTIIMLCIYAVEIVVIVGAALSRR